LWLFLLLNFLLLLLFLLVFVISVFGCFRLVFVRRLIVVNKMRSVIDYVFNRDRQLFFELLLFGLSNLRMQVFTVEARWRDRWWL
jgi:hypothetical protein